MSDPTEKARDIAAHLWIHLTSMGSNRCFVDRVARLIDSEVGSAAALLARAESAEKRLAEVEAERDTLKRIAQQADRLLLWFGCEDAPADRSQFQEEHEKLGIMLIEAGLAAKFNPLTPERHP